MLSAICLNWKCPKQCLGKQTSLHVLACDCMRSDEMPLRSVQYAQVNLRDRATLNQVIIHSATCNSSLLTLKPLQVQAQHQKHYYRFGVNIMQYHHCSHRFLYFLTYGLDEGKSNALHISKLHCTRDCQWHSLVLITCKIKWQESLYV